MEGRASAPRSRHAAGRHGVTGRPARGGESFRRRMRLLAGVGVLRRPVRLGVGTGDQVVERQCGSRAPQRDVLARHQRRGARVLGRQLSPSDQRLCGAAKSRRHGCHPRSALERRRNGHRAGSGTDAQSGPHAAILERGCRGVRQQQPGDLRPVQRAVSRQQLRHPGGVALLAGWRHVHRHELPGGRNAGARERGASRRREERHHARRCAVLRDPLELARVQTHRLAQQHRGLMAHLQFQLVQHPSMLGPRRRSGGAARSAGARRAGAERSWQRLCHGADGLDGRAARELSRLGFVDGETLRDRVQRAGPLPPRLATKLLQEVAWALGAAHQRGVIHRDVKPDNIMIERATERAVVTDFGIALGRRAAETAGGAVTGTARYMSPEQACGEPVDARSDLYSLGATFFYALTGRAPFEAANVPAIITKHVYEPAPLVQTLRPEVPTKLAAVVDRLLRKAAPERFQTADDLARVAGEVRGRDFRAPPLLRAFVRNAQVSTLVLLTSVLAGRGTGLIGAILLFQLVVVARRLLKDGYTFGDIRAALLAERQVQQEEDEVIKRRRWFLRLDSLWYRIWAGRAGRSFFWLAGWGLKTAARPALPSVERTELVLGRSALAAYKALPDAERRQARDLPAVLERLETGAEALRARGDTGESLTEAVAALEHLRLALVQRQSGVGSPSDLTLVLERARAIGDHVDRRIAAAAEVQALLE